MKSRPRLALLITLFAVTLTALGVAAARQGAAEPRAQPAPSDLARATFAGGCFWCMEPPFDELEGVYSTTSGYTGGPEANPTYEQVSSGNTGHAEAVQVLYDPAVIGYDELLEVFWHNVDPTTPDRQFCDRGAQYRTAIFTHDEGQQRLALESRKAIEASGQLDRPIVTEIVKAGPFYPAEEYHQNYYEKNPIRYKYYRRGCGRDRTLERIWGKQAKHKDS